MATRRDRDLPSHPSTSPSGRPRIPEREITTTDVTQHAEEILTDQDFSIVSPGAGDVFRYNGIDWINTTTFTAAMTFQSQATFELGIKLTLAADGNAIILNNANRIQWLDSGGSPRHLLFMDASDDFRIRNPVGGIIVEDATTFEDAATIDGGAEVLALKPGSLDHVYIGWYADTASPGTRSAYMGFGSAGSDELIISNELGSKVRIATGDFQIDDGLQIINRGGDELLRLNHTSATGNPYISFYQAGAFQSWVQYNDTENSLRFGHNNSGIFEFRTGAGELLRLVQTSATGSPYISFYQDGTRGGYFGFSDSFDGFQLITDRAGAEIRFYASDTDLALRLNPAAGYTARLQGSNDNLLQLYHTSATGNPYISWIQGGTTASSIQHIDSGNLFRLRNYLGGLIEFYIGGTREAYIDSGGLKTTALEDTATRFGLMTHSLVGLDTAGDFNQPSGYRTMARNDSLEHPQGQGSANSTYYFWNVLAKRDANQGYTGLATGYTNGRMWYGENSVGTSLPNWYEIFTEDTPVLYVGYNNPAGQDSGIKIQATGTSTPAGGHAYIDLIGDASGVSGEPGGAYIRMTQDAGGVEAMFGITQSGAWPNRDALSGVSGNDLILGIVNPVNIRFITNNALAATLASGGDFTAEGDVIATV